MDSRKILYVADLNSGGTAPLRFAAMKRIARDIVPFDQAASFSWSRLLIRLRHSYPVGPVVAIANRSLLKVEECAEKARYYLDHEAEREAIARRGRERAVASGYDNDTQLRRVLLKLDGVETPPTLVI